MKKLRQQIGGLGNLMFKEAYIYSQFREGLIPDMYVQSPKYWGKYASEVKHMFSEGVEQKIDKISLHFRRGDYVGNPFYVDLTKTDYYQKAVEIFPNEKFLVFCKDNQNKNTDNIDREWCKVFVSVLGVSFEMAPRNNTEDEDMNLMASCKGHIMANSSFSWWASFIGSGTTVAPTKWFTDGVKRIYLLDEWIKL